MAMVALAKELRVLYFIFQKIKRTYKGAQSFWTMAAKVPLLPSLRRFEFFLFLIKITFEFFFGAIA